jgi:hypothetical protein
MNAPCPIEICPAEPVNKFSPSAPMHATRIVSTT